MITDSSTGTCNDETRALAETFLERSDGAMPTMIQAGVYSVGAPLSEGGRGGRRRRPEDRPAQMRETPINDFYTKNGKIREDGRVIHDLYLLQVKTPAESKYPWDYYKILDHSPATRRSARSPRANARW